jgi:hypothetical protein
MHGDIRLEQTPLRRSFIGVTFSCCNVYTRLYLNKAGTAYEGSCPRCYRRKAVVKVVVEGGVDDRFFTAD